MNTEKKFVCPVDKRQFATKAALQQHKKDSHAVASPATSVRGRGRGRGRGYGRQRGGATGRAGFDPAPSRVPPSIGDGIVLTGEDRVDSFKVSSTGSLFKPYLISPGISPRLGNIAKGFQKIEWRRLVAYVTPQASAITNGGYVAGFVMDPSDESVTASHLASNRGAITKKWYETAVVPMPPCGEKFFTSPGEDPRFSFPGRFWVVADGMPQSQINVVVTFVWTVRLSKATVEREDDLSFTIKGSVIPRPDNYNVMYQANGTPKGDGSIDDFSDIVPKRILEDIGEHYWRVPTFNIEYAEGTGDTGTRQMHFFVYRTSDKRGYYSSDGITIDVVKWQGDLGEQVLIPCGTFFRYAGKAGNVCGPSGSQGLASTALQDLEERVNTLTERLRTLEASSSSSYENLADIGTTLTNVLTVAPRR